MKNFVLLPRANTHMSPTAFSDPKELQMRAQWLENLKSKEIIVSPGGTMPPIPNMAVTIFSVMLRKKGDLSTRATF